MMVIIPALTTGTTITEGKIKSREEDNKQKQPVLIKDRLFLFIISFMEKEKLSFYYCLLFAKRLRSLSISRYNQTIVTNKPHAPYHSIYLGAPVLAPTSIISKSSIRLKAAIATINRLIPIASGLLLPICINGM